MMDKTVGIVGFGSFGRFLAEKISPHFQVRVFSRSGNGGALAADLAEVAAADYVILAVPLNSYEEVLNDMKPKLGQKSVVVDVCSVKQKPAQIIRSKLPGQPMVATHPLFGRSRRKILCAAIRW